MTTFKSLLLPDIFWAMCLLLRAIVPTTQKRCLPLINVHYVHISCFAAHKDIQTVNSPHKTRQYL